MTASVQRSSGLMSETVANDQELCLNISPNPANTYFTILLKSGNASPVTIQVVDMPGQVIERYEKINSTGVLRLGHKWAAGIYYAGIIRNREKKMIKMIKIN